MTKSQVKASTKYNKANTTTLCLRFNLKTDKDIIDALETVENKTGYIKELIRLDYIKK